MDKKLVIIFNLNEGCRQVINISSDNYAKMLDTVVPKCKGYKSLDRNGKIKAHLDDMAVLLKAKSYTYEILK
jgi:hypothetical protein